MSYTKHTWVSGEVITADNLNHMEDGIAAGEGSGSDSNVYIVTFTINGSFVGSCDRTLSEIHAASTSGKTIISQTVLNPKTTAGLINSIGDVFTSISYDLSNSIENDYFAAVFNVPTHSNNTVVTVFYVICLESDNTVSISQYS